ncbi:MAG: sugar phosphate isomerase/epimerase, partial [Firmicutes bacterium]|nr:sugar phosphate isomerase/epimerase [Bacillota bacterium]
EGQLRALQRCIELAHLFDTRLVRSFSFWRLTETAGLSGLDGQELEKIAAYYETPLTMAARNRVILALENEHACRVASGAETERFFRLVRARFPDVSSSLGLIWDPGNAFFVGEKPYPDGYRFVRNLPIVHVHVKDARVNPRTGKPEWAAIGQGEIDFPGFLSELNASGYSGVVSLETHFRREGGTPEEATRESFGGLMAALKSARI